MVEWEKVTLDRIAGGAAIERFQEALDEIVSNILDPNTDIEKVREVKLTLKLKPSKDDRGKVLYSLSVDKKLAPPMSIDNLIFVGKENGEVAAYEQQIDQGNLFNDFKNKTTKIKNIREADID